MWLWLPATREHLGLCHQAAWVALTPFGAFGLDDRIATAETIRRGEDLSADRLATRLLLPGLVELSSDRRNVADA